jgi:aminoglycoside-2''-adenylyltransferase
VCGGWAIDLFVGERTREHEDLEVGVFRHHQAALHSHYEEWDAYKSIGRWLDWEAPEQLELPIHQVLFRPPGSAFPEPWEPNYEERQFFLNEAEGGIWTCRRDPRLRLHVRQLAERSPDGVPIVVPEVQLLYKAAHAAEKDQHDFDLAVPRLSEGRRRWLREALELVQPGHRWIQALP